jgi:hypothetical protein
MKNSNMISLELRDIGMQNKTYSLNKKLVKNKARIEQSICHLGLEYFFVSIIIR